MNSSTPREEEKLEYKENLQFKGVDKDVSDEKFGVSETGSKMYIIEQLYDFRIVITGK